MFAAHAKEYLDMPDFPIGGGRRVPDYREKPLSIEFHNVEFTYRVRKEPTIRDFNLKIRPGEKLAVVGVNGAGKTTLVKLLCGLCAAKRGSAHQWGSVHFFLTEMLTIPCSPARFRMSTCCPLPLEKMFR